MHARRGRSAHHPDQCLDPEGEQRRGQHEHQPERDDLPADQRAGDQEVRVLRDQIEERLRHGERGQRPEVKPATGSGTTDGARKERTIAAE